MSPSRLTGRATASERARIVAWIVAVTGVGMVLLIGAIVVALRWIVQDSIHTALVQEAQEVATFAQTGVDPATGEDFTSPERFVEVFLQRQRAEPTELITGGTPADPAVNQLVGPDAVAFEALAPQTREELLVPDSSGTTHDPTHGRLSWTNITVQAEDGSGHVLVVNFHTRYDERVRNQIIALGLLAVAALGATAAVAWAVSNRILSHIDQFRTAVETVLEKPGLHPLPENGSDEYAGLARSANALIARADQEVGQERRFTEDVTFAVRTPLTVIEAGLHNPGPTPAQQQVTHAYLGTEATRLRFLVDDLVMISRLQADAVILEPADFAAGPFVASAARAWHSRQLAAHRAPELDIIDESAAAVVRADQARLVQVLEELLDNAAHALAHPATPDGSHPPAEQSEEGEQTGVDRQAGVDGQTGTDGQLGDEPAGAPTITVRIHLLAGGEEPVLAIDVSDPGRGIPAEERDLVLERLARASNDPQPGNGLGLSIAYLLMEAMGGSLQIVEGEQTTVRLQLSSLQP